jgi:hypothetical protein
MNRLTLRLADAVDFNEQALYCVAEWRCDLLANHQVVPAVVAACATSFAIVISSVSYWRTNAAAKQAFTIRLTL